MRNRRRIVWLCAVYDMLTESAMISRVAYVAKRELTTSQYEHRRLLTTCPTSRGVGVRGVALDAAGIQMKK